MNNTNNTNPTTMNAIEAPVMPLSIIAVYPANHPDENKRKKAISTWKDAQTTIPAPPPDDASRAIVCGAVSGNLEMIDFDAKEHPERDAIWNEFLSIIENHNPALLQSLYIESTPSGGHHIVYRLPHAPEGNQKLSAMATQSAIFETRGEGGYFLFAHPRNDGYEHEQNTIDTIPTITADDHAFLFSVARSYDERPVDDAPDQEPNTQRFQREQGDTTPGDDYNQRASMSGGVVELLQRHGWTVAYKTRTGAVALTRPGKTPRQGISATFNHIPNRFYVFSSSTQFQQNRAIQPFAVYAILEHNGDFKAAARALARDGYGTRRVRKREVITTDDGEVTIATEELDNETILEYVFKEQAGDAALVQLIYGNTVVFDKNLDTTSGGAFFVFDEDTGHWRMRSIDAMANVAIHTLERAYTAVAAHLEAQESELTARMDNALTLTTQGVQGDTAAFERMREQVKVKAAMRQAVKKRIKAVQTYAHGKGVVRLWGGQIENYDIRWDANPDLLGVANGVIDLSTRTLIRPNPSNYIRKTCPTDHNPHAQCPRFRRFITEIFPDEATQQYIHRLLGYAICGHSTEHILPILYGPEGRNGKDTLINTIAKTLGKSIAHSVSKDVLMSTKDSARGNATPQLYALMGARVCWVNETEEGGRLNVSQLKQLTGNSEVSCRPLYGQQIQFMPTHTALLITNHKPSAPSDDDALWSRVHLIEFKQRFVENPQKPNEHPIDKTLGAVLASEAEGILQWLLEGHALWRKEGLQVPPAVKALTTEYRWENEVVGQFCAAMIKEDPTAVGLSLQTIREAFNTWAIANGYDPKYYNGRKFGGQIEKWSKGLKYMSMGYTKYKGIALETPQF